MSKLHPKGASWRECSRSQPIEGFTWRDTQAVMRTMCIRGHEMRLIWARHKDHSCDSLKWVRGAQHYRASPLVSRPVCSQPLPKGYCCSLHRTWIFSLNSTVSSHVYRILDLKTTKIDLIRNKGIADFTIWRL